MQTNRPSGLVRTFELSPSRLIHLRYTARLGAEAKAISRVDAHFSWHCEATFPIVGHSSFGVVCSRLQICRHL
jgi:hypothetical protein